MKYTDYKLEDVKDSISHYSQLCNMLFNLTTTEEQKSILQEILYEGGYNGFALNSDITNKDNPMLEAQRRLAMGYLFARNPESFKILAAKNVNLFHGTRSVNLYTIAKYGLRSFSLLEDMGIKVTTGEKWSRINNRRGFISFTDILDIAQDYSTIESETDNKDMSFGIIVGTTVNDVYGAGKYTITSDVPEVGVNSTLPLESIKVIGVPSDKVEFVKRIINNDNIEVLAIDDVAEKFYYIDDFGNVDISLEKYNDLKNNIMKKNKSFNSQDLRNLSFERIMSNIKTNIEKMQRMLSGGKIEYDGRSR